MILILRYASSIANECTGFREFDAYLSHSPDDREQDERLKEAVEHMKLSTRQYARRQIKWLRSKLLSAVRTSDRVKLFVLDANGQWNLHRPRARQLNKFVDLGDAWTRNVRDVAIHLTDGVSSMNEFSLLG